MTDVTVKRGSGGGASCEPNEVIVHPQEKVTWISGDANMKLTGVEFVDGSSAGFAFEEPQHGGAGLAARATKEGEYPYKIRYKVGEKAFEGAGKVTVAASGATSFVRGSTGGGGG